MTWDLVPLELLAATLTAALLAIPIAVLLSAALLAVPETSRSRAGLALGASLLLGVILAGARLFVDLGGAVPVLATLALVLGILAAIGAAVLLVLRPAGSRWATALAVTACVLLGLAEPSELLPVTLALSPSVLVALAAIIVEAVAIVAVVAAFVALGSRVRALQIGVATAAAAAGVVTLIGLLILALRGAGGADLPGIPLDATLIVLLVALILGSIAGAVVPVVLRSRRQPSAPDVPDRADDAPAPIDAEPAAYGADTGEPVTVNQEGSPAGDPPGSARPPAPQAQ